VDTIAVLAKVGLAKVGGYADRPWRMLVGGELVAGRTAATMPVVAGASFGGVKNSGLGREESLEEIESYTQHKNVYIAF
jgi:acyl-CoA reductase-like NAD-dependent aldehyde dehydrogenase